MISGVYTCTTWNLRQKYHSTIDLHNLILTTFVQLSSRVVYLYNLKFSLPISLFTTLAQPHFLYICTTWYQNSTLAQTEILIFIVNLHTSCYSVIPWFSLHSQNKISVAYVSCCVYMFSYIYIFCTHMHNFTFTTFVQHNFRVWAIMAIIYDEAFSNSFHQKKENPYNISSFSYHNH